MENIQQSYWKYNEHGEWLLCFDKQIQHKISNIKNKLAGSDITLSDLHEKGQKQIAKVGNMVMTPKGIGRLLKIDKSTNIFTIKIIRNSEEKDYEFPEADVSIDFYVYVKMDSFDDDLYIKVPLLVSDKFEGIIKYLEVNKLKRDDEDFVIFTLGKVISESTQLETTEILQYNKVLLISKAKERKILKRFNYIYTWWHFRASDGICFQTSKNIKLEGVSLFRSHENKTMKAMIAIVEGDILDGTVLHSEKVEVLPTNDESKSKYEFNFEKAIKIRANQEYVISLTADSTSQDSIYHYYGSSGQATYDDECGCTWTFKDISCSSNISNGNFEDFKYTI